MFTWAFTTFQWYYGALFVLQCLQKVNFFDPAKYQLVSNWTAAWLIEKCLAWHTILRVQHAFSKKWNKWKSLYNKADWEGVRGYLFLHIDLLIIFVILWPWKAWTITLTTFAQLPFQHKWLFYQPKWECFHVDGTDRLKDILLTLIWEVCFVSCWMIRSVCRFMYVCNFLVGVLINA